MLTSVLGDLISFESECINDSERYALVVDDRRNNIPTFFECGTFFGTSCNAFDDNTLARISNRAEFDIARDLIERTDEVFDFLLEGERVFLGINANPPTGNEASPEKFSFNDNFPDKTYIHSGRGEEPWLQGQPNDDEGEEYCVTFVFVLFCYFLGGKLTELQVKEKNLLTFAALIIAQKESFVGLRVKHVHNLLSTSKPVLALV